MGAGRRFWSALLAVLVMLLAVAGPVDAWQVPTTGPTTSGTLGTPSGSATLTLPNGVTETITGGAGTGTAQTAVTGGTTLGSRGYVSSDYTNPALTSSTPAVSVVTDLSNNCPTSGTCSGLGSFTIRFSSPVVDPVLAIGGICGEVNDILGQFQSQLCDILHLTTAGVTLSKVAGSNLSVTGGNTIGPTNPNASYNCATTAQIGSNTGAPILSSQAPAACGQVQVLGTVTSLTFSVSGIFTPTDPTGVVQGDSCNDPNGTCADGAPANGTVNGDGWSIVAVLPDLSLSLTKSANPTVVTAAGQPITYSFLVKNTGNVTMSNVGVTDTQVAPAGALTSGPTCPVATLAPGASETCSATYTVTQADLNNGSVNDSAVAHGTPPGSTTPVVSGPSTATVPAAQRPSLSLLKTANRSFVSTPGEVIKYSFLVSNTGNVTFVDLVVVDGLSGLSPVVCPVTTLAPGASTTCSATYTVTQADLDHGGVLNAATVQALVPHGTSPGQRVTSPKSTVKVPAALQPVGNAFSDLAFTGAPIVQLSLLGATLLLLGGVFLVAARRRRGGRI